MNWDFSNSPSRIASGMSFVAALLVFGIWYILLFTSNPSGAPASQCATDALRYFFSAENPSRSWFVWLAMAPVISTAVALAYLSGASRTKPFAIALFVVSVVLGVTGFYFVTWTLALFVALPAYWGFLCVRKAA